MRGFRFVTTMAVLSLAAFTMAIGTGVSQSSRLSAPTEAALTASRPRWPTPSSELPVSFLENRGQADAGRPVLRAGKSLCVLPDAHRDVMSFAKQRAEAPQPTGSDEMRWRCGFVGADPKVEPSGADRAAGVINDLRGSDPVPVAHADSRCSADVVYTDLWPKIDLRLREQSGVLKYEFHVRPGASPSDIGWPTAARGGLALGRGAADLDRAVCLSDISGHDRR